MSADERRLALEHIAYGSDPRITPEARLKALDDLRQYDAAGACRCFAADVEPLEDDELDRETDAFLAVDVVRAWLDGGAPGNPGAGVSGTGGPESPLTKGLRERFPETIRELDHGFERRVEQRAAELADAKGIEARIAEEAELRAEAMYRQRSFRAVVSAPDALDGTEAGQGSTQPPEGVRTPTASGEIPPGVDLARGWPPRRSDQRQLGDRRRGW